MTVHRQRAMTPLDITRIRWVSDPQLAPDARRVAFVVTMLCEDTDEYLSTIWVVDTAGGEPHRFTTGPKRDTAPRWSPDGTRLAFVSEREAKQKAQLYVMPADGGEPTRLTALHNGVAHPVWSPDSSRLAFLARVGGWQEPEDEAERQKSKPARVITTLKYKYNGEGFTYDRRPHIFVVSVDGGPPQQLTDGDFADADPIWSPDSATIAFTSARHADAVEDQGDMPIYRVRAAGGTLPERVLTGARQITGVSHAQDSALLAFTATDPVTPPEVFLCHADGTDERQLTDLNRAWKAEVALSRPERLRYERAGHRLDCWVIKPFGYVPGQRYPALLNIHGGPHTQYGHTFFDEFQVYAGAGYAVMYTNPRGSQGYGEAFTRAVHGDWGGGDFADVMAGVDEALRQCHFIDPERLGVMGGSYGRFLASWTVGHTQRFKAACSERAVNSVASLFGTSDIGASCLEAQSGALPWENLQWYVEHSPLTYAQHITTPLLILHAEDDLRCPMEQAEQLFAVLKRLHREVLFVRFPDENHEMSRAGKPRHRLERYRYLLDWFAGYLL